MINDGKLDLLEPIGEVKESPKSHILGFMNKHCNKQMPKMKTLRNPSSGAFHKK
jgi:hypothetical protein